MRGLATVVVLAAILTNALSCADGCVAPAAPHESATSNAETSSDTPDRGNCVICVTPFVAENIATLVPTQMVAERSRPGPDMPAVQSAARIDHPPKVA